MDKRKFLSLAACGATVLPPAFNAQAASRLYASQELSRPRAQSVKRGIDHRNSSQVGGLFVPEIKPLVPARVDREDDQPRIVLERAAGERRNFGGKARLSRRRTARAMFDRQAHELVLTEVDGLGAVVVRARTPHFRDAIGKQDQANSKAHATAQKQAYRRKNRPETDSLRPRLDA